MICRKFYNDLIVVDPILIVPCLSVHCSFHLYSVSHVQVTCRDPDPSRSTKPLLIMTGTGFLEITHLLSLTWYSTKGRR